jgi:5S rRNA maturation endonuclease (ribonuclease M5)
LRLNTFVLYLDENICNCQQILKVLEAAKVKFRKHLDMFPTSTKDVVFLPLIGKRGWTLLTCDTDIRRRELERQAVLQHRVRMFVFTSRDLSGEKMGRILQTALQRMRNFVRTNPPPFIASITDTGAVHLRLSASGKVPRAVI